MSPPAGAVATIEPDAKSAGVATKPADPLVPDAKRDRAPAWLRLLPWVALGITALGAAGMTWNPTRSWTYSFLTDETGAVELSTFLCFLGATALAAFTARFRGSTRGALVVFALVTGLAALEEISWGQQLFGFGTPGWLFDANAQGETNLHNLEPVTRFSSRAVLMVALLGLVMAFRDGRRPMRGLRVPRVLMPIFLTIVALASVETANDLSLLGDPPSRAIGTITELTELWLALACLLVARFQLRGKRNDSHPGGA